MADGRPIASNAELELSICIMTDPDLTCFAAIARKTTRREVISPPLVVAIVLVAIVRRQMATLCQKAALPAWPKDV